MLDLAADENFKQQIINGLRRRLPRLDVVTVRGAGIAGAIDPHVLAWAAGEGRVLLSHDTRTIKRHAYARVAAGEPMVGVLEVPDLMAIGHAVEELALVVQLLKAEEIQDRVLRLPL